MQEDLLSTSRRAAHHPTSQVARHLSRRASSLWWPSTDDYHNSGPEAGRRKVWVELHERRYLNGFQWMFSR